MDLGFILIIFVAVITLTSSAEEATPLEQSEGCTGQKALCYDCDSRYDASCDDPFDESSKIKPSHRLCYGCCVKHVHQFANEERIVRSCSEKLVLRHFVTGCMDMGSRGVMCFCNGNFCNGDLNHTMATGNIFRVDFGRYL